MIANGVIGTTTVTLGPMQAPAQRADAEVAKAMQDAMAARQEALQQAEAIRQQAQQQAQAAQQEAQREIERARREIDRAVRDAQREAGRSARGARPEVTVFPGPFPGGQFPGGGPQVPDGAVIISVAFFVMCAVIAIGFPIARAIARRMDRRNAVAPGADADTRARLERIEQAVDAIAVEVERISEGQRFTTKVMNDLRALPQGDPSVAIPDRAAVPLSRAREVR
jgi:multidrug efflux pump subunit AcrA (membrane-fusion protein)